jgi:hypothetical protein
MVIIVIATTPSNANVITMAIITLDVVVVFSRCEWWFNSGNLEKGCFLSGFL